MRNNMDGNIIADEFDQGQWVKCFKYLLCIINGILILAACLGMMAATKYYWDVRTMHLGDEVVVAFVSPYVVIMIICVTIAIVCFVGIGGGVLEHRTALLLYACFLLFGVLLLIATIALFVLHRDLVDRWAMKFFSTWIKTLWNGPESDLKLFAKKLFTKLMKDSKCCNFNEYRVESNTSLLFCPFIYFCRLDVTEQRRITVQFWSDVKLHVPITVVNIQKHGTVPMHCCVGQCEHHGNDYVDDQDAVGNKIFTASCLGRICKFSSMTVAIMIGGSMFTVILTTFQMVVATYLYYHTETVKYVSTSQQDSLKESENEH